MYCPKRVKMKGVQQPPQFHPEGDVWVHTLLLLEKLPAGCSATLAWGALLHDLGKPATFTPPKPGVEGDRIRFNGHVDVGVRMAEVILHRLRFSNEDAAQIVSLIKNHMRFGDIMNMRQATLTRFLRLPQFEEHLALHKMDATSSNGDLSFYEFAKQHFENEPDEEVRPKPLVNGRDLILAGYRPGTQFKEMLETAEDAQLDGLVANREEALKLLRERFGCATAGVYLLDLCVSDDGAMVEKQIDAEVLVLGGGMAGLAAARTVAANGTSVMLLEAQARVCGRILTQRVAGEVIELGAEFVHGRPSQLLELLAEADLTLIERSWVAATLPRQKIDHR